MVDLVDDYQGHKTTDELMGIAYRDGDTVIHSPSRGFIRDLDALPYPAYDLLDMDRYLQISGYAATNSNGKQRLRTVPLVTSRGCPFKCVFCSIHSHMGRRWRAHSAEYIDGLLRTLRERYRVEHCHIEDDNLTVNRQRCLAIIQSLDRYGISWDARNGVRADTLDSELLRAMKQCRCKKLIVAPESGSQRVLEEVIGKKLDLESVRQVAADCKRIRLQLDAFFVLGFPGETLEEMKQTVSFAEELRYRYDVTPQINVATPLIGTRLHEICKRNGYLAQEISPRFLSQATSGYCFPIAPPEWTADDIRDVLGKALTPKTWKQSLMSFDPYVWRYYVKQKLKQILG